MTGIPDFYAGRCIFITGATGFMGKVLVEKILRSCPAVKTLYLLVRPKKGKDGAARIDELLDSKLFERLRSEQPDFKSKVQPIAGDILEAGLGLSQQDRDTLIEHVSIVFHSAATVKFDEALKLSVKMNICGVQKLLELCHKLDKLEAFLHVSTAYANCDRDTITEAVYTPSLHPNKLLDAVEWMNDDVVETLTPKMVAPRPNTYTYTKAMAEYLLVEECGGLPVAILRPSIVGATWEDPMPGWVDNFNGPTGLLAAIGKGFLRSMYGDFKGTADIVPVDLATNMMIAVAWYTAIERPTQTKVYNCTTGSLNKLTWGVVERSSYKYFMKHPLDGLARIPNPRFTKSAIWRNLNLYLDHYLPAWILDMYCGLVGQKAIYTRLQNKLWKSVECLEFFTMKSWTFTNDNMLNLMDRLSQDDQKIFNFDMKRIHWPTYMENYCIGTKQFALKEEVSNISKARQNVARLQRRNKLIQVSMGLLLWRFVLARVPVVRNLWYFILSVAFAILKKIPMLFAKSS